MYDKIKKHPPVRKIYAQKLIGEGLVTEEEADEARRRGLPGSSRTRTPSCARR